MESLEKEKAALILGIETDASAEAEKILREAENQVVEKRKYSEKKIESILNEARKKAEEQAETVKKKIISSVELELKRHSMLVLDAVMQDIKGRVENKLESMTSDTNYGSVLIKWITEAAVGLDAEAAQVNASEKERTLIDDKLLSEAKDRIYAQSGREVTLTLSDTPALESQGIVLTAADGRTAFNNQVKTRMLRKQREIRMLIYNALFHGKQKE